MLLCRFILIPGLYPGHVLRELHSSGGIGIGGSFSVGFFYTYLFLAGTGSSNSFSNLFHERRIFIFIHFSTQRDFHTVGLEVGLCHPNRTIVVETLVGISGTNNHFLPASPRFRLENHTAFVVIFVACVAAIRAVDAGDMVFTVVFIGSDMCKRCPEGLRFTHRQPAAIRVLLHGTVGRDRFYIVDALNGFYAFHHPSVESVGFNGTDDSVVSRSLGDSDPAGFLPTGNSMCGEPALLARDDGRTHTF